MSPILYSLIVKTEVIVVVLTDSVLVSIVIHDNIVVIFRF